MFSRSLRAVFREGILYVLCRLAAFHSRSPCGSSNFKNQVATQQHVLDGLPHEEHRGDNSCLLAAPVGWACAARQVAARSIRPGGALFNPEVVPKFTYRRSLIVQPWMEFDVGEPLCTIPAWADCLRHGSLCGSLA